MINPESLPMPLNDIQRRFKDTILDGGVLDNDPGFRTVFRAGGISLENRMKVYRNNVVRTLADAVIASYPMTGKLIGKEYMERAARLYAAQTLPAQGNLNLYGGTFPDFIAAQAETAHLPFLRDFAALEWMWEESYYAADDAPLAAADLQNITEDRLPALQLSLRASARLLKSIYPLDVLVDFCQKDGAGVSPDTSARSPLHLIVIRPSLTVELRRLASGEYTFLAALEQGAAMEEAAQQAFDADENFDLSAVLQKHLQAGTFTDFRTGE